MCGQYLMPRYVPEWGGGDGALSTVINEPCTWVGQAGHGYLALHSAFLRAFVSPGGSLEAALWTLQGLTWRSSWNLGTILEQMWIHTVALQPNWPPGPS